MISFLSEKRDVFLDDLPLGFDIEEINAATRPPFVAGFLDASVMFLKF